MNLDQIIRFRNFKVLQLLIIISVLSLLGWGILLLNDLIKDNFRYPEYITQAPESIIVVAFFSFLILGFVLVETVWIWFSGLDKRNKIYKFKSQDWPDDWIFNGVATLVSNPSGLHIKSSRAGTILREYSWRDLEMTFEMRYARHLMNNIGVIFRALDLDNYFMLEIILRDNQTRIQPLVRYRGAWETSEEEELGSVDWSDSVRVRLNVKDALATLEVGSFLYEWILPTHVDVNHIEAGGRLTNQDAENQGIAKSVPEIPFRLDFGMIGFRAHQGQGAIIRNLKVKPL